MSSRELWFRWRSDSSQLQSDFGSISKQTRQIQRALQQLGKVTDAGRLSRTFETVSKAIQKGRAEIERYRQAIAEIQKFQQGRTGQVPIPPSVRQVTPSLTQADRTVPFERSQQIVNELQAKIGQIEGQLGNWRQTLAQFNNALVQTNGLSVNLTGPLANTSNELGQLTIQTKQVKRALLDMGQVEPARGLIEQFAQTRKDIKQAEQDIVLYRQALQELQKFSQGRTAAVPLPQGFTRGFARSTLGDFTQTKFSMQEVEQVATALQQKIQSTRGDISSWIDALQQVNNELIEANRLTVEIGSAGDAAFQRRVERAGSRESVDTAVQERINQLEQTRNTLLERRAQLQQRVFDQLDPSGRAKAQQHLNELTKQEQQAARQVQNIQAQRLSIEERLNAIRSRGIEQFLTALRQGKSVGEARQTLPSLGRNQQQDIKRFIELTRELQQAQSRLFATQQQAAKPRQGFGFTADRIGVSDEIERINTLLAQTDNQIAGFAGPGALDEIAKIAPNLFRQIRALNDVSGRYKATQDQLANATGLTARQFRNLQRQQENLARLQNNLTVSVERGTKALREQGLIQPFNFDDVLGQLGRLEQTLIGAFRGFGRRFQATLQFSLSAGLIFGAQRFLREFFETAIEVERAFEDIATALEFDIEAPRGSQEFRRELEVIRREVLLIANEFNVLPTTANEVAFKMVSRFQDMNNAMEATRFQMLALKISTIETDEVLRSLTAAAEAFANEVLTVNANLSLQERLLQRESAAASNYGRIVDLATVIQQEWGVEFEDTIDGVARAGPTFQSLGFTMQETSAIVAAAARTLPGTGSEIAERLTRAFGAFTNPEVREKILEFAAQTDNLTLSFSDFEESGKRAFQVIQSQIDQLDPGELVELQQIIGQRREVEVVSAVLGTGDIQNQINAIDSAAGAAERRFAFLETTTREFINSILTQFQELAQNLERIGVLTPFRALLSGANLALEMINKLLKAVINLIEGLNKIPVPFFGGLGDSLTTVLALGVALRSVLKTLEAIGVAQGALGVGGLAGAVTGGNVLREGGALGAPLKGAGGAAVKLTALQVAANLAGKGLVSVSNLVLKFGQGLKGIALGIGGFARALFSGTTALKQHILAIRESIRTRLTDARTGLAGGFRRAGGTTAGLRALGIATAVTAFGSALLSLKSAIDQSKESFERHSESVAESRRRIQAEAETRGLSPDEVRIEQLRAELDIARNRQDVGGFGNILRALLGTMTVDMEMALDDTDFVRALLEFNGIATEGMGAQELRDAAREWIEAQQQAEREFQTGARRTRPDSQLDPRELFPGSAERNVIEEAGLLKRLAELEIQLFRDSLEQEIRKGRGPEIPEEFGLNRQAAQLLGFDDLGSLQRQADILAREIEAAAGDPDALLALLPLYQEFTAALKLWRDENNKTLEGVEGTIALLKEDVERAASRVEIGEISPSEGIAEAEKALSSLQDLLRDTEDPQRRELIRDAMREVQQQQADFINTRLEDAQALNEAFLSEEDALRANIEELRRAAADLRESGNIRKANELELEIVNAEKELQRFVLDAIRSRYQFEQGFADTPEETLRLLRAELEELKKFYMEQLLAQLTAIFANPFGGGFDAEFLKEIADMMKEIQKRIGDVSADLQVRRVTAEAQAAGPVLSNLTRINAQIAGLREEAAQATKGTVEHLEIINKLNEALANQALELLRRQQAYVLFSAGVNDVLKQTKAEISNVTREIDLAIQLYGANSAEVFELKKRQQTLQQTLIEYELELRDLNRRLNATDLTNQLETAELELFRIAQALAAPDMGPLEKARLELEKRHAEIAHERAFFDDRLFELQFLFETGAIGSSAYIAGLQSLLEEVDTSTKQGKEIFLEIQGLIDGLTDDVSNMQFNVPTSIRMPTIFEVRRSLAADQLGVNYQDNRQQDITIDVETVADMEELLQALLGAGIDAEAQRFATGGAGITIGGF